MIKYSRTSRKDAKPVMTVIRLLRVFSWVLDLHIIHKADEPNRFHSHKYKAYSFCIKGEYVDEQYKSGILLSQQRFSLRKITPQTIHRVHEVKVPCVTLWFHGKETHELTLYGDCDE